MEKNFFVGFHNLNHAYINYSFHYHPSTALFDTYVSTSILRKYYLNNLVFGMTNKEGIWNEEAGNTLYIHFK